MSHFRAGSANDESQRLNVQIRLAMEQVDTAKGRIRDQRDRMALWRAGGIDPEVKTDYSSSTRQSEGEHDLLERYENDAARAEMTLESLIGHRKKLDRERRST